MSNIYKKLLEVQTKLKAPKSSYNSFGNYKYRNCEDILEGLKPLLKETQTTIIISDMVENLGNRYYIKTTVKFVDVESGESIETTALAREEENKKGMDSSQITGSASSYARKVALSGMFCIDDNKDSDTTNVEDKENIFNKEPIKEAHKKTVMAVPEVKAESYLSEDDLSKMYKLGYKCGYTYPKVDSLIKENFNKKAKDLDKEEYQAIILGFENLVKKNNVGA